MLTLGGVSLLLPDMDGSLKAILDRTEDIESLCLFCDPLAEQSSRTQTRLENEYGVGLPLLNFSELPKPRINTLVWPTGASRWAYGVFLASTAQKDAILEKARPSESQNYAIELKFGDENQQTIPISVYVLPPRPLFQDGSGTPTAWLIPVVDERYYWQYKNAGEILVGLWSALFSDLGTALGVTVTTSGVDGAYLYPDDVEFLRRYDNAAMLLDAAAASVGRRIVRWYDGTVKCLTASEANGQVDDSVSLDDWDLLSGGDSTSTGEAPFQVRVCFAKFNDYRAHSDGGVYTYAKSPPASITNTLSNTEKIIHGSAFADFTGGSVTPDNNTTLNNLATIIASDYYAWFARRFSYTFAGVKLWYSTGYESYVEWRFANVSDQGVIQAQTHIEAMPSNFGIEQQLSRDIHAIAHFQYAKLDHDLSAGGSTTATIWDKDGTTGRVVTVYEKSTGALTEDADIVIHWHFEDNRWYVMGTTGGGAGLSFFRVHLTEKMGYVTPNQAAATTVPGGATIAVKDPEDQFPYALSGAAGLALYDGSSYYLVECQSMAGMILATLTEDMGYTLPGQAGATVDRWNGSQQDWQQPPSPTIVYDTASSMFAGLHATDQVFAVLDATPGIGKYYIVATAPGGTGSGANVIRFELTAHLSLGGLCDALAVIKTGGGYVTTGSTITVKDFTASPGSWAGDSGYRGWAVQRSDSGVYEIIWMERVARVINFTLTADMASLTAASSTDTFFDGKDPGDVTVHDPKGLFLRALSGALGTAHYNDTAEQYEVVECHSKAGFVLFTLYEPLSGGSAMAYWDNAEDAAWGTQQDIQFPAAGGDKITVYDTPSSDFQAAGTGDRGIASLNAVTGHYGVIAMLNGPAAGKVVAIRFELLAPLTVGGSADAKQVIYSSGSYHTTGGTITVKDFTIPGSWYGPATYRGWAIYREDTTTYEIVWMETPAKYTMFSFTTSFSSGDATALAFNALDDGYGQGNPPGDEITVHDPNNWFRNGVKSTSQRGIGLLNERTLKYLTIAAETLAGVIIFALDEKFAATTFDAAGVTFENSWGSELDFVPPTDSLVYDEGSHFRYSNIGDVGIATYDRTDDRYHVICMLTGGSAGALVFQIELDSGTHLLPGGNVLGAKWVAHPTTKFTVYDPLNLACAFAGEKLTVFFNTDTSHMEVLHEFGLTRLIQITEEVLPVEGTAAAKFDDNNSVTLSVEDVAGFVFALETEVISARYDLSAGGWITAHEYGMRRKFSCINNVNVGGDSGADGVEFVDQHGTYVRLYDPQYMVQAFTGEVVEGNWNKKNARWETYSEFGLNRMFEIAGTTVGEKRINVGADSGADGVKFSDDPTVTTRLYDPGFLVQAFTGETLWGTFNRKVNHWETSHEFGLFRLAFPVDRMNAGDTAGCKFLTYAGDTFDVQDVIGVQSFGGEIQDFFPIRFNRFDSTWETAAEYGLTQFAKIGDTALEPNTSVSDAHFVQDLMGDPVEIDDFAGFVMATQDQIITIRWNRIEGSWETASSFGLTRRGNYTSELSPLGTASFSIDGGVSVTVTDDGILEGSDPIPSGTRGSIEYHPESGQWLPGVTACTAPA